MSLRLPNDADSAEQDIPVETLTETDHDLIAAARAVLAKHYRPFWHMVSAALRSRDGRVWTGIHLGATVGRLQICAEAIALGREWKYNASE
jgi:cytidine deaminase